MRREWEYFAFALRYYPSRVTGEFINVGVAVVCPELQWWDIRLASAVRGFRRVFPTAQPVVLIAALKRIERAAAPHRIGVQALIGKFERWEDPLQPVRSAVGNLWGSLAWSTEPIVGTSADPAKELDYWFTQLVHIASEPNRTGPGVPKAGRLPSLLQHEFQSRGILEQLQPAEVGTYVKETFGYTYSNGRLNVFEAIRLNFGHAARIRSRAQMWRGKLDTLNDGLKQRFNFFAIVDLPEAPELRDEADVGLKMIQNAQANRVETFTSDRIEELGALAEEIISNGTRQDRA